MPNLPLINALTSMLNATEVTLYTNKKALYLKQDLLRLTSNVP